MILTWQLHLITYSNYKVHVKVLTLLQLHHLIMQSAMMDDGSEVREY